MDDRITVTIPYWKSPATIRRAVHAVINQTHTNLTLIVINDGDHRPPWHYIADINDPRLIRYDLNRNRGRYFADAVALAACNTPWYAVHDADDAAHPNWLAELLRHATHSRKPVALTAYRNIDPRRIPPKTTIRHIDPVPTQLEPDGTTPLRHLASWVGLWNTDYLRSLGGPHPDYRVGYDTLLTHIALASDNTSIIDEPLYDRYLTPNSLTRKPSTGLTSNYRKQTHQRLRRLWNRISEHIDNPEHIRAAVTATISRERATQAANHARQLAALVDSSATSPVSHRVRPSTPARTSRPRTGRT